MCHNFELEKHADELAEALKLLDSNEMTLVIQNEKEMHAQYLACKNSDSRLKVVEDK